MKWRGRRASDNVEDYRGRTGYAGGSSVGLGLLLNAVGRRFGIKGILVLIVLGVVLWKAGLVDPTALTGAPPSTPAGQVQASPEEQERLEFVKVMLADNEDIWAAEFARHGLNYENPKLVIYRGQVPTGCGLGSARAGPFYCPVDRKVYIDLGFYDELARTFHSPGDFAQAYVIAHEIGHHVQNLLGTTDKVQAHAGQPDYNEWSVRLELQADYYAGVWANHSRQYLEAGDIEEALRAANAIGDDAIQQQSRGKVVPHSFTHGTSEQRMRWFNKGWKSGDMLAGDTFSMPYDAL